MHGPSARSYCERLKIFTLAEEYSLNRHPRRRLTSSGIQPSENGLKVARLSLTSIRSRSHVKSKLSIEFPCKRKKPLIPQLQKTLSGWIEIRTPILTPRITCGTTSISNSRSLSLTMANLMKTRRVQKCKIVPATRITSIPIAAATNQAIRHR